MKTIFITAYAVNPYKGSEDGMGWNFILQAARFHRVIAVTRVNNGPAIEQYMLEHPRQRELFRRIRWQYFDWPQWLRFWKRGPLLSMIYFYGWQATLPFRFFGLRNKIDLVHNLNFHNNWTPTFLWLLGKPLVWGPVGHHDRVPRAFLRPVYGAAAWWKDRLLWMIKQSCWHTDPFLRIAAWRADHVLCMNTHAAKRLRGIGGKWSILPSVAAEETLSVSAGQKKRSGGGHRGFSILSVGRLVPLKGFDLAIRAFSIFYQGLPEAQQRNTRLLIIGSGPEAARLQAIIDDEEMGHCIEIRAWIPRHHLLKRYKEADVLLFSSHEGAGMVVAEAMSYGLPVVCLDNAGPGEFLHPDSTLKVPLTTYARTLHGLAERLTSLVEDRELLERESRLASERFRERFCWDVRGGELRKVYATVLADRGAAATPGTSSARGRRVIAVHLLNDLSGSPLVFSQVLETLQQGGYACHLFTATPSGRGFLTGISGVTLHPLRYRWSANKLLTLLFFFSNQFLLLLRLLFFLRRDDIVYINTSLPLGAALAARLRGCRTVYHLHEVSIRPAVLKRLLLWVISHTADYCIYVSRFVLDKIPLPVPSAVIPNALPDGFTSRAISSRLPHPFTVLLLCSLKRYKGIEEFVACAGSLPELRFELVLNATPGAIDVYFRGRRLPPNLAIFPAQADTHPFYSRASVVVNLSLIDQWVETFGMTILEAMCYGLPVIVPPEGGVRELVLEGVTGYFIDSRNQEELVRVLRLLHNTPGLAENMGKAARERANYFSRQQFDESILSLMKHIVARTTNKDLQIQIL